MQLLIFPIFIIDFAEDPLTIEGRRTTKKSKSNLKKEEIAMSTNQFLIQGQLISSVQKESRQIMQMKTSVSVDFCSHR